jgi:hypothetical protein
MMPWWRQLADEKEEKDKQRGHLVLKSASPARQKRTAAPVVLDSTTQKLLTNKIAELKTRAREQRQAQEN